MSACCPTCGQAMPQRAEIAVDLDMNTVVCNGNAARLTRKEAELAKCLADAHGRVVTRGAILDALYGLEGEEPVWQTLDQFVLKIRRKLGPLGITIENHWARGWSMKVKP